MSKEGKTNDEYIDFIIQMVKQFWIPQDMEVTKWVHSHPFTHGYEPKVIQMLNARIKLKAEVGATIHQIGVYTVNIKNLAEVIYYVYDYLNNRYVYISEGSYHEPACVEVDAEKMKKTPSASARKRGIGPQECCKWKFIKKAEHEYPPGIVEEYQREGPMDKKKPTVQELQDQLEILEIEKALEPKKQETIREIVRGVLGYWWRSSREVFRKPSGGSKDISRERMNNVMSRDQTGDFNDMTSRRVGPKTVTPSQADFDKRERMEKLRQAVKKGDGILDQETQEVENQKPIDVFSDGSEELPISEGKGVLNPEEDIVISAQRASQEIQKEESKAPVEKSLYSDVPKQMPVLQWLVIFVIATIVVFVGIFGMQKFSQYRSQGVQKKAVIVKRSETFHQSVRKQIDSNAKTTGIEIWLERIDLSKQDLKIYLTWRNTSQSPKRIKIGKKTSITCGGEAYFPERIRKDLIKGHEIRKSGAVQVALLFKRIEGLEICETFFILEDGYGRTLKVRIKEKVE